MKKSLLGPKELTIIDVINGTQTRKDLNDRIINAALGHNHLIVVTMSFIYIFNVQALGVKDHQINFTESFAPIIGMCEKYFAVVHSRGINMYFYDTGKQMKGTVDFKNINVNANVITPKTVSFANDTIAIKDYKNEKNILFYYWDNINSQWNYLKNTDDHAAGGKKSVDLVDASQGRNQEIVSLALDQHGSGRHVAYIDKNNDVYLKVSFLMSFRSFLIFLFSVSLQEQKCSLKFCGLKFGKCFEKYYDNFEFLKFFLKYT